MVKLDFLSDFKKVLQQEIAMEGFTFDESDDVYNLTRKWISVQSRMIPKKRWQVEISDELETKSASSLVSNQVSMIRAEAVAGEDLNSRCSRQYKNFEFNDRLLHEWGLFHLHLGVEFEEDGFRKRTTDILFVHPKNDKLFLVDILPHANGQVHLSDVSLLEIVHRNWPELISRWKLGGIIPPKESDRPTAAEISQVRRAGICSLVTIGDAVFASPGGSLTTAGTNPHHTMQTGHLLSAIKNLESVVLNSVPTIRSEIQARGKRCPKNLSLILASVGNGKALVQEPLTNSIFAFPFS